MNRRGSFVILAVLGVGVFLAGLESMITAVALPSILVDLAGWTQLREASWIVNGYLLVYVATMPLAGRLSDTFGARRLFLLGLFAFTVGSFLAGPRRVSINSSRRDWSRPSAAASWSPSRRPPRPTCTPATLDLGLWVPSER